MGLYSVNCPEWVLVDSALVRQGIVSVPLYDTLGNFPSVTPTRHHHPSPVTDAQYPPVVSVCRPRGCPVHLQPRGAFCHCLLWVDALKRPGRAPHCPSVKLLVVYGLKSKGGDVLLLPPSPVPGVTIVTYEAVRLPLRQRGEGD